MMPLQAEIGALGTQTWNEGKLTFVIQSFGVGELSKVCYLDDPTYDEAVRAIRGVSVIQFTLVFRGTLSADIVALAQQHGIRVES